MLIQEITNAVNDGDIATARDAFRALIDFPHERQIAAAGPSQLVIALNQLCEALQEDTSVMPGSICEILELPPGSSYGAGAIQARKRATRFGEAYTRHYEAKFQRAD